MPIPGGGAGGRGGASEDLSKLKEAIALKRENIKEIDNEIGALGDLHPKYDDLIKKREEEVKALKELKGPIDDYNKKLLEEVKNINSSTIAHKEFIARLKETGSSVLKTANYVKDGIAAYYSYNLSVQHAIDATGQYIGQSAKARQEFDAFRRELNLTRKASLDFAEVWSQGMRLGVANSQLKEMIGNLQKIHGQTQGLKMAREIMATPVTAQTMKGVAGGNVGAAVEAMRMGSMQQMQAIASTFKKPGGRDAQTEAAIRFERSVAKYETAVDDIKAGMQAFAAAGVGPEASALLGPVTDIAKNVASIAQNSSLMKQLMVQGGGQMLSKLPGVGGLVGKLFGTGAGAVGTGAAEAAVGGGAAAGGGGALAGAAGTAATTAATGARLMKIGGVGFNFSNANLVKGGLFAAAGELGGRGLEWGAGELEKRGHETAGKWARVGGMTARGAGYGAAVGSVIPGLGTAAGAGVGAAIGGTIGIAQQFGDKILDAAKEFGKQVNYYGEALGETLFGKAPEEKEDFGDMLRAQGTLTKTVQDNLSKLGPTLDALPESIRVGISARAGQIGLGTAGREGVEEAKGDIQKQVVAGLYRVAGETGAQRQAVVARRDTQIAKLREQGAPPEQIKAIETTAQDALNSIEKTAQDMLVKLDVGRGAQMEMQRGETRRGQFGLEREAATTRFRMTGAITGDQEAIKKYMDELNRTFGEDAKITEETRKNVNDWWDKQDQILKDMVAATPDNKELAKQTEVQLRENQRRRQDDMRNLDNVKAITDLNKMEAEQAAKRTQYTAYELTASYKQAQYQKELAGTQLELAKMRGASPQELTRLATEQHAGTARQLAKAREGLPEKLEDLGKQIEAARALKTPKGESEAQKLEETVFTLKKKEADLAKQEFADRQQMAEIGHEQRFKELGIQKNILETVRDSAAKTGASWRVQMQYQSQILAISRAEVEEARTAYADAVASGKEGAELMAKGLVVAQKEAAYKEAVMGKQRDFLEKAVGRAFGMGGGSKVLPNFSPRVFGEIVKDVTGGQWQGAPKTIEQTRQAMGGNLRGGIGGAGVGMAAGGGLQVNAAPAAPPGAGAGAGEAAAAAPGAAGAAGGGGGGVDVSGNFKVDVKMNTNLFTTEVEKIVRAEITKSKAKGGNP